jgi:hypothetical protein
LSFNVKIGIEEFKDLEVQKSVEWSFRHFAVFSAFKKITNLQDLTARAFDLAPIPSSKLSILHYTSPNPTYRSIFH